MTLKPDPSGVPRLIGDNTSESVDLFGDVYFQFGEPANFPAGIWMLGGNDEVVGAEGESDLVFGNEGDDTLLGDFGNDTLWGGKGTDILYGNEGNDCLGGGQDADAILGFAGNDVLLGGRGNDILYSGEGNDTLIGGLGRDVLAGLNDDLSAIKVNGSNLYVIQAEAGVTDVDRADVILAFRVGFDRIGLAGGLTVNDIVLENLTNVPISIPIEGSGSEENLTSIVSGTLIKTRNSGNALGFVTGVTPNQIQSQIIAVQGF